MKAVQVILILCLLASMDCFDIWNFFKCLLAKPVISSLGLTLFAKIKNEEGIYAILGFLFGQLSDVTNAVKECYNE